MLKILAALLLFVGIAPAYAQQGGGAAWIGPVVAGHCVSWFAAGILNDAGTSCGGGTLSTLTIGTHLTGGSYNGSAPVTIATDATSANTPSTLITRDASGNFAAGMITSSTSLVGAVGSVTLSAGELAMAKITASGTAPGAGALKIAAVAGTTSGTCKIIVYAGTSTTPVTLVDNVGSGC